MNSALKTDFKRQSRHAGWLGWVLSIMGLGLLLWLVQAAWLAPRVEAKPTFLARAVARYPQIKGHRLGGCILCHRGGLADGERNPFATDFEERGYDFGAIEGLDSDGDGFTNKQEFMALTFPGNPKSVPGSAATSAAEATPVSPADTADSQLTSSILNAEYLIPMDHPLAPFLESRAFAASQGATVEFDQLKSMVLDSLNNKLYLAFQEIGQSMSDERGHIQLAANPCGGIYEASLDDSFNLTQLAPAVMGELAEEVEADNFCKANRIAGPNHLAVDSRGNLWIAEEGYLHRHNMLWAWNRRGLNRFATAPQGAALTGLHLVDDTIFFNVAHPDPLNLPPYDQSVIGVVAGFAASFDYWELPLPQDDNSRRVMVSMGEYQVLGRVGDALAGQAGADLLGQISLADNRTFLCNHPAGNMFIPVSGETDEGYLYTNFACWPGGISQLYLRRLAGEKWTTIAGEHLDFQPVRGLWRTRAAGVTPWQTGLTGEGYEPETGAKWPEAIASMTEYLGQAANPYDYGYAVELTPQAEGGQAIKHYALGRAGVEQAVVMPDRKTVYFGSAGENRVLFKFIATIEAQLGEGTLYAAQLTQNDTAFEVQWLELGSTNNATMRDAIIGLAPVVEEY